MDVLFQSDAYQSTGQACLTDLTPPTFAGITTLEARPNGSLRAAWAAASDPSTPITYEIYVQKDSSVGLFSPSNLAAVTRSLTIDLFQDADGDLLEDGQEYFIGVRAIDSVGNQDVNTVSLSEESTGVPGDNCASMIIKVEQYKESVDKIRLESLELTGEIETNDLEGVIESQALVGKVEECP